MAVPFLLAIHLNFGDKTVSFHVEKMRAGGPFFRGGIFIHTGWDGPTGSFSSADIFFFRLGSRFLRFEIVEDPIAAAQRRLPKTLEGRIATLESKDSWLRFCAFRALAAMGASAQPALPALVKALERGDREEQGALSTVSKAVGAQSVSVLTNALANRDATVRQTVSEILGEIGPEAKAAIPSLILRLHDPDLRVVAHSALALWKVDRQTRDSVPVLVKLLADGDAEIRAGAAATLGEFGSESGEAVPALLKTLEDTNVLVRAMSARSLGMIGPGARAAIPRLVVLLDDASREELMWIAKALSQFGEEAKDAVPKLTRLAARDDDTARWAIEALAEMGANAVPGLVELYRHVATRDAENDNHPFVAKALIKIGTKASAAAPVVAGDLDSEKIERVIIAAHVLGYLGESARIALPRLKELLTHDEVRVRVRAAGALWSLDRQTNAVLPVLLAALRDNSIQRAAAKRYAAEALAEMGPVAQEAVPLLETMLHDQQTSVRQSAAEALKKITGREMESLSQEPAGPADESR
ncbi:MAG TPA: HEAT repeat domain-containing protein [Candidatus Eisenbacteria bacterium]|nr:HEAT repeat domain-containing protein [Candidatus Eisenbacteria bacterium]